MKKKKFNPRWLSKEFFKELFFMSNPVEKLKFTGENLLAALFSEKESYAVYILNRRNISRLDVVDYISHGKTTSVETEEIAEEPQKTTESYPDFLTNLNALALEGKIDPLIGREDTTTERLFQILGRRRKNNPVLVGESGVGKTAIAEGLAKAISENRCPDI